MLKGHSGHCIAYAHTAVGKTYKKQSLLGRGNRFRFHAVGNTSGDKNVYGSSSASTSATNRVVIPSRLDELKGQGSMQSASTSLDGKGAQSKLLDVSLQNSNITTDSGFAILENVDPSFSARKDNSMPTAIVLGLHSDRNVSLIDKTLGSLKCRRFLACARIKLWWMVPEWGSKDSEVPPETQFMLLQLGKGGPYAVLLPLIDSGRFRGTLRPPRQGRSAKKGMTLRVESGDDCVTSSNWDSTLLVAAGYDPFQLADLAVAAAARLSGGAKPRVDKVPPKILDCFGWCTWDAFYSTISAEGIQQGLQSLKDGGVPPKFLIIDDGWQQTGPDSVGVKQSTVRLEAKKEMLKTVGAGGHYPTNRLQDGDEEIASEAAQQPVASPALEGLKGRAEALTETALFAFYKLLVENAPADSWRVKGFAGLANGPLKETLLAYYALTSDHTQRLKSVRANGKFSSTSATPDTPMSRPEDLASIVQNAKDKFGVKFVYAWHSLHGYWAGIATGNSSAMPYNAQLVMPKPTPAILELDPSFAWQQQVMAGVGVAADVQALYQDMHSYLRGAGIDGVKVDCQATLGMVGGGSPSQGGGPAMSAEYHAAMENSVAHHFPGNSCINCMCHSTEDIYRMENTTVARSSDDFWPADPASHTTHVAVNAYNSLFMGALVQPDWDMFHSRHPAALLHATARVVSGGPIYVSDKPGHHDFNLLKRLVLDDGSLLRCTQAGLPTLDTLFEDVMRDKESLLKIWNMNSCNGIVATFNLQGAAWSRSQRKYALHDKLPGPLSAAVSPIDLQPYQELPGNTRFAVYSDRLQQLWSIKSYEGVQSQLQAGESDIFTVVPIQAGEKVEFAPIGLTNMLNSGGAISSWSHTASDITFKVRGQGKLLAFCTQTPKSCTANGESIQFNHDQATDRLLMTTMSHQSSIVVTF